MHFFLPRACRARLEKHRLRVCDRHCSRLASKSIHLKPKGEGEAISIRRMVDAEFRLKHIAAGWRWKNVRAVPLAGEDGSIEKCSGMNLDIHDRKFAEEAVRESEERLKSATVVGRKFSLVFELEKLEEVRARGMCSWRATVIMQLKFTARHV